MNILKVILAFLAKLFAKQITTTTTTVEPVIVSEPVAEPAPVQTLFKLSAQNIATATGARFDRATEYLPYLLAAMAEFDINTPQRQAMFLAQIGHESGGLHWTVEIWGPTSAQSRYEGRTDLGNTTTGDGYKFRGRGLLQTTGRYNYMSTGQALNVDLCSTPELLGQPEMAARSAAWFWKTKGLNQIADRGDNLAATKRINGGINGLADRQALYSAALLVFA